MSKLIEILKEINRSNGRKGIPELQALFLYSKIIWRSSHRIVIFWGDQENKIPWQIKMAAGYIKLIHTDVVTKDRTGFIGSDKSIFDLDQDTLDQIEMLRVMTI